MKNKIIENILLEERERPLVRQKVIEHRLKTLPSGWIREIRNKVYKYLSWKKVKEFLSIKEEFSKYLKRIKQKYPLLYEKIVEPPE